MKIESRGFRIAEICEQVPMIEVDGVGEIKVTVRQAAHVAMTSLPYMTRADFDAFYDAMTAVRERLDGDALARESERKTDERPLVIVDSEGDRWVWRDDHSGYVLNVHDHEKCAKNGAASHGVSLESIEKNWGPLTFPKS